MLYQIKCAWCDQPMGTKEDAGSEFADKLISMGLPVISHCICPSCSKKALEDANTSYEGENHE